jgi:hypothetical protein
MAMGNGPLYRRDSQGLWPTFVSRSLVSLGVILVPVVLVLGILSVL